MFIKLNLCHGVDWCQGNLPREWVVRLAASGITPEQMQQDTTTLAAVIQFHDNLLGRKDQSAGSKQSLAPLHPLISPPKHLSPRQRPFPVQFLLWARLSPSGGMTVDCQSQGHSRRRRCSRTKWLSRPTARPSRPSPCHRPLAPPPPLPSHRFQTLEKLFLPSPTSTPPRADPTKADLRHRWPKPAIVLQGSSAIPTVADQHGVDHIPPPQPASSSRPPKASRPPQSSASDPPKADPAAGPAW